MSEDKVPAMTLSAWLFAAMSAPLAQIGGGAPWLFVLAVGAACGLLCWFIHALAGDRCCRGKWYCLLQFLFLILAAGTVAGWCAPCWPTGRAYPAVPLVLLALAAASAWDGAGRASRVGGVVFWFVALLFAIVLAAGIKDVNPDWLLPQWKTNHSTLLFVFLIPSAATFLPRKKGKGALPVLLCILGFGVAVSLLTLGTVSPQAAQKMDFPFYEYSKSLSLLGVAERFEAFVSVALTMGHFALLSLFFTGAGHLAEAFCAGGGRVGILLAAGTAAVKLLLLPDLPDPWLPMLALLLWGVLPFATHTVQRIKKPKKVLDN